LKKERIRKKIYRTRDEARAEIFNHIKIFYNKRRCYSYLGGMSPGTFEQATGDALWVFTILREVHYACKGVWKISG
jgi:transposase InsO family protein